MYWCGTFNNFTEFISDPAELPLPKACHLKYAVWQHECGKEEGTPHLQMYLEFESNVGQPRSHFNKLWGVPKITKAEKEAGEKGKGLFLARKYDKKDAFHTTRAKCRAYCMKEDTRVDGPWQWGEWTGGTEEAPVKTGSHPEICMWKDMIDTGCSLDQVMLANHEETLKHHAGMSAYYAAYHRVNQPESDLKELRPWQLELEERLLGPVNPRKVIWYYDPVGNMGKTAFIKHMRMKHSIFSSTNGKTADIALAYQGERIVMFNYTRAVSKRINYDVIEALQDNMIMSTKYQSHLKCYPGAPHIVCMANCLPDFTVFSEDRYEIIQMSPEKPLVFAEERFKPEITMMF